MLRIVYLLLPQLLLWQVGLGQTNNKPTIKVRFGNSIYYQLKTDVPGAIHKANIVSINDSVFILKNTNNYIDTIIREDFSVLWIANAKYKLVRYSITAVGLAALPLGIILIKDGIRGYGFEALITGIFTSTSAIAAIIHFNKIPRGKLISVSHSKIKFIP
jgi:hypothetical protein